MSLFLRALAAEIDARADPARRDALLRTVGHRMAQAAPLAAVGSLEALEAEMNAALQAMRWGRVRVVLSEAERAVLFTHRGLPSAGAAGDPPGSWLGAALEGLYEGWMASQPGAEPGLVARRAPSGAAEIVLKYGRGSQQAASLDRL